MKMQRRPGFDAVWVVPAVFALSLSASGCMLSDDRASLSLQPEVRPALADIDDLDSAALARLAKATAENGGDAVDPVILYRQLSARMPSDPAPRVELGRLLLKRKDIDGADAAFQEALALAPNSVDTRVGSAQILLARHRSDEALRAFEAVLADQPDNVRALNGRGLALDQLGRRDEAQVSYRRALALDPENGVARNNLGLSLALSGNRRDVQAVR
ncbi:tetratricopeptide repeat protein [Bradyrhizobium xenonodulans]|uniref:Tetratricopeptide repeat protein n=1 Tax=Bradyrhizobium xenonodulans TaxID=2736875 RepID=A0ABY7MSP0_9BRAD|nr:tetratricopeptide repeat protein [Bradyrhizobium xenonodulans]WBL81373.1 tetratricopeptide repeat protein [Bradyrhizobium xenonodulans]